MGYSVIGNQGVRPTANPKSMYTHTHTSSRGNQSTAATVLESMPSVSERTHAHTNGCQTIKNQQGMK